jgi:pimeloyl-ACP methyl ester carboxylesterase
MTYETFTVPVSGGDLVVGVWGDGPPVLGIHGITASHPWWGAIVEALAGKVRLIAPDLRGRGDSGDLPPPHTMQQHVDDCLAVLDHLGIGEVPVVGMSMGGWVATLMASKNPDRVKNILLLDGGLNLAVPPGLDVEEFLAAILASSFERLSMTFESYEAFFEYWRQHPAIVEGVWNEHTEASLRYDLKGEPPELRSKVSKQAVLAGSRDQVTNPEVAEALGKVKCPIHLIRASRGLQNEPSPIFPDYTVDEALEAAPHLTHEIVEDTNHYELVLAKPGATLIAKRIIEMVDEDQS